MLAGMTEERFWNLTPSEIERELWAHVERERQASKGRIAQAWFTAALSRYKRLPTLTTLLSKARPVTGDEQKRMQADHEALVREMS